MRLHGLQAREPDAPCRQALQDVEIDGTRITWNHLQVRPDEFAHLFITILIKVTSFFRDPEVWDALRTAGLPQMIERIDPSVPIRVWSAGCASGGSVFERIILAEILGIEAFTDRVKIYATDVDEETLREARQAVYNGKDVADVPEPYLEKYSISRGNSYTFSRDLRRCVIFGRHDLIQDAPISPISRFDLMLRRNTLMHFNADAQSRNLSRFHFWLPVGLVVMGRAEMLFSHAAMLSPVDLKRRVFTAVPKVNHRQRQVQSGRRQDGRMLCGQIRTTSGSRISRSKPPGSPSSRSIRRARAWWDTK